MYKQLTREQRYAIYLGIREGKSQKAIARQIEVHPSTVSREIRRNSNSRGHYLYREAHDNAKINRERHSNRRLKPHIKKRVIQLLAEKQWSPVQISGSLALEGISVSHETIYRIIRSDNTGTLKSHCRHKLKKRKRTGTAKASLIPNRTSIHDRPVWATAETFGNWEMDLIVGAGQKSAILVLVERSKNYVIMSKLKHGKKPEHVADEVIRLLLPYKRNVRTITTDNGTEFRCHEKISKVLAAKVYFADPYSAWQKGAVENMNKLIRQYLPKGTDFRTVSDEQIKQIQYKLNQRPREKLGFKTPKSEFFNSLL